MSVSSVTALPFYRPVCQSVCFVVGSSGVSRWSLEPGPGSAGLGGGLVLWFTLTLPPADSLWDLVQATIFDNTAEHCKLC